ncbi:hypothetical protein AAC387_Pa09g1835 [Persea americana]
MALQSLFTGLFYCILFFHPSTTFYCLRRLRPHPPSRREKAPSPPPPPPTSASSHAEEHTSSFMKKLSSKHKKKDKSHDKPHHTIPPYKSPPNDSPSFKPTNPVPPHPNNNHHLVSELRNGEPALHVIQTIFQTGWTNKVKNPTIEKVLKIHHSAEILKAFEDYRETVKSTAAKTSFSKREERWVADGNELLRFHSTATACELGYRQNSSICERTQHCSVCNIIRYEFPSGVDKLALCESSWRANEMRVKEDGWSSSLPRGLVVRRAMFVCRVIAGRVAYRERKGLVKGEEGGFDSIMGGQKELVVLDPKSLLPCFIVMYNV